MNRNPVGAAAPARLAIVLLTMILASAPLSACRKSGGSDEAAPAQELSAIAAYPDADMSGYAGLRDSGTLADYRDLTVADIADLMEQGETFAFMASFSDCPWCNAVIAEVNAAALEAGSPLGILDTRKDPAWQSNMDLADYDLFTELFGEYLEYDDDGLLHLYAPHFFCLKEGAVVYQYQGALPEMDSNPDTALSDAQKEALTDIFRKGFDAIR